MVQCVQAFQGVLLNCNLNLASVYIVGDPLLFDEGDFDRWGYFKTSSVDERLIVVGVQVVDNVIVEQDFKGLLLLLRVAG